jgi:hypothetical protein
MAPAQPPLPLVRTDFPNDPGEDINARPLFTIGNISPAESYPYSIKGREAMTDWMASAEPEYHNLAGSRDVWKRERKLGSGGFGSAFKWVLCDEHGNVKDVSMVLIRIENLLLTSTEHGC